MAEFTRNVSDISTQSAPQLKTNTGSLATDALSAAAFGVELYQKNKAQKQEQDVLAKQSAYDATFNQSLADVAQFVSSQNLTGSRAALATESFIAQKIQEGGLSQADFRAAAAKMRGGGSLDILTTSREKEALAEEVEVQKEIDYRNELVETASGLSGYSTESIDFENATVEELEKYTIQARVGQSSVQAREAKAKAASAEASNEKTKRTIKVNDFNSSYISQVNNKITQEFKKQVKSVDFKDPKSIKEAIDFINGVGTSLPQAYRDNMKEAGFGSASAMEVETFEKQMDGTLSFWKGLLNRKDLAEIGNSVLDAYGSELLLGESDTPSVQMAKNAYIVAKVTGTQVGTREFSDLLKSQVGGITVSNNIVEGYEKASSILKSNGATEVEIQNAKEGISQKLGDRLTLVVPKEEVSPEVFESNAEVVQDTFTGSRNKIEELVKNKGWKNTVEAFANNTDAVSGHEKDVLEVMKTVTDKVIAGTIGSFLNTTQSLQTRPTAFTPTQKIMRDPTKSYSYDYDTMTLKPVGDYGLLIGTDPSIGMNKLITDTYKMYENLGADPATLENFKKDVYNALVLSGNRGSIMVEGSLKTKE